MSEPAQALLDYHQRSKHRIDRYAPGPGGLDWANQPNPFREYAGAPQTEFALAADTLTTRYDDLRRGALPASRAFDLSSLGILFELSLGLSAWKSYGANRWALRCNPSSGNLHPTEAYLVCPRIEGLPAGVHHYLSRDHRLEQRAAVDDARWNAAFAGNGVVVGLSSIYWREAWKYGMRAWRYCQHDCGHAIAALSYAAAALGWQTRLLRAPSDEAIAGVLGIDRTTGVVPIEIEHPDALLWIGAAGAKPDVAQLTRGLAGARWHGCANRLSREHVRWPDIDAIHEATRKPATPGASVVDAHQPRRVAVPAVDVEFATLARQRRSAVDFDGRTHITDEVFFTMLDCLAARSDAPPWNAAPGVPLVHPAFMVHRVTGLQAGLYLLVRDPAAFAALRQSMRSEWVWRKAGPDALPLYLLLPIDLTGVAKWISCHQDIGRDACFALGMIAHFDVARSEPWRYRQLYWECGMLGQVLYLEAEAAGVRATGIGCFFDDEMHALLGLGDLAWQSLYHFTVGAPVDDPRLSTMPPYTFQP